MVKSLRFGVLLIGILLCAVFYTYTSREVIMPTLSHFEDTSWLEQRLTEFVKLPVHIQQSSLTWRGLLHPSLDLVDLRVATPTGQEKLHIKHLKIGIDLLSSLLRAKIIPGDITMEGTRLVLQEKGQGKVSVNEIPSLEADLTNKHSTKLDAIIDSFLSSGTKVLKNVDLSWYDQDGHLLLPLEQVNMLSESHWLLHDVSGTAKAWQHNPISYAGHVTGLPFLKKYATTYLKIHTTHLSMANNLLVQRFISDYRIKQGLVNLDLNFKRNFNRNIELDGKVSANQFEVVRLSDHQLMPQFDLVSNFAVSSEADDVSVGLSALTLTLQGKQLPFHRWSFEQRNTLANSQWVLKTDLFPLKETVSYLRDYGFLSSDLSEKVTTLDPSGLIKNFQLKLTTQAGESDKRISLSGQFKNVNFNPLDRYPGVKNLTGNLNFSPYSGSFALKSSDMILTLPHVFRQALFLQKAQADLSWRLDYAQAWHIKFKNYNVVTPEGFAAGDMKLIFPEKTTKPIIRSRTTFTITNFAAVSKYYPIAIMPKAVVNWLSNSIKAGQIKNGLFIMNGPMNYFPFDKGKGEFRVSGDLQSGGLHYKDHWPEVTNLNGRILFTGRSMAITAKSGEILSAPINQLKVNIENLEKAVLSLKGEVSTSSNQRIIIDAVNNPLSTRFDRLPNITLHGGWNLALNLSLPLHSGTHANYQGALDFKQVDIQGLTTNQLMDINKLRGKLWFSEKQASTSLLQGEFLEQPFRLSMNQLPSSGEAARTEMNFTSTISAEMLQKKLQLNVLNQLHGSTAYSAKMLLVVDPMATHYDVLLTSDLRGLQSNLPVPFAKTPTLSYPTQIRIQQNKTGRIYSWQVADQVTGVIATSSQSKDFKGIIHFGAEQQQLPLPQINGIQMDGRLAEFDVAGWRRILPTSTHASPDKTSTVLPFVNKVNLDIDRLIFMNRTFTPVKLSGSRASNAFNLGITSETIKGDVHYPYNFPATPISGHFDYVTVPQGSEASQLKTTDLFPLDLFIAKLDYHNNVIQNLTLKIRPIGNNIAIRQLDIDEPGLQLTSAGIWNSSQQHEQTSLSGSLKSSNLGAFLNQWHVTDNVVKGEGVANFDLIWASSPLNAAVKKLNGSMDLYFKEGRIIKLGSQADFGMGVGRLLNLLSLQTLPRRLMGDFSDLTESGYSFDKLKASLIFRKGDIFTDNAMLDGTIGRVKIKGRIGLARKDYDVRLVINPNVTSSLPVVATLTAGPIVGAATWLIDKVFSHEVKKMTEIHYNVTGSWANPDMETLNNNSQIVKLSEKHD